ncbi:uncharacterized protein LOC126967930 [Leptidea sinapis]|uniref:uncharacterized protein LOC126967930 n=1 Tax=Leptidea sinapis TaxID=189913 RepID=UPI0021238D08|nr:uncharacterized protein LOC126967930 [Leptidea sinapis]
MLTYILTVTLLVANAFAEPKQLGAGPNLYNANSTSLEPQKQQKRFATKEVIVYLTPSQIKDLQSGKAVLRSDPEDNNGGQILEQVPRPHIESHHHFENLETPKSPLVKETKLAHLPPLQNLQIVDDNLKRTSNRIPHFQFFYPQQNFEPNKQENKEYKVEENNEWTPIISVTEKNQKELSLQEQLKEHWAQILENNREQLKFLPQVQGQAQLLQEKNLADLLHYAPKYNEQKYEIELERALRAQEQNEAEKNKARAQAEAIANSPPVIVRKEVKITQHKQVPVVKHVNVPYPTPVLVPIPEPFEVKVPQPYPVPLEIIKHIPVPLIRKQKLEVDRLNEAEKLLPIPVSKPLFFDFDRPFLVDRIVPVEHKREGPVDGSAQNPEKLTILRHRWLN